MLDDAAGLLYIATRNDWEADRLTAAAKYLVALARSVSATSRKKPKIV